MTHMGYVDKWFFLQFNKQTSLALQLCMAGGWGWGRKDAYVRVHASCSCQLLAAECVMIVLYFCVNAMWTSR